MSNHDLKKNDPVYYKCALRGLIAEAKENGLKIGFELLSNSNITVNTIKVLFENDIGEIAGAVVYEREV